MDAIMEMLSGYLGEMNLEGIVEMLKTAINYILSLFTAEA